MKSGHWVMLALALGIGGWPPRGCPRAQMRRRLLLTRPNTNTKDSASCGIQEAIDATARGRRHRDGPARHPYSAPAIFMKPRSKLVGAGRSTVLKKGCRLLS